MRFFSSISNSSNIAKLNSEYTEAWKHDELIINNNASEEEYIK